MKQTEKALKKLTKVLYQDTILKVLILLISLVILSIIACIFFLNPSELKYQIPDEVYFFPNLSETNIASLINEQMFREYFGSKEEAFEKAVEEFLL